VFNTNLTGGFLRSREDFKNKLNPVFKQSHPEPWDYLCSYPDSKPPGQGSLQPFNILLFISEDQWLR